MVLKVSRCLFCAVPLLIFFAAQLPMQAQSVPCAAITRNPLVLEALLDYHSKDAEPDLQDDTINGGQLERLQFSAIVIQPGDALYMEYRGKDFTIDADFASGERTAFDSSPKGSYEQWRKGVLPLDTFRGTLNQRLVRLRATAKNPNQVLFRNIKIIRAGKPVFEFAKLISYGKPKVKTAVKRQLPCVGFDDVPASGASTVVNYSLPNPGRVRNFSGGLMQPTLPPFPMMMQSTTTNIDPNHYKFTGKELDDETGLYNYGARYYGPALGRFMTPDWSAKPVPIPYADLSNPQTLNLYAYTNNNPTTFGDADGHCQQDQSCLAQQSVNNFSTKVKDAGQALIGFGKQLANAAINTANLLTGGQVSGGFPLTNQDQHIGANAATQVLGASPVLGELKATTAVVDLGASVRAPSVTSAVTTGTRYVGTGEAAVIEQTGMVPNTNAAGVPKQLFYTPESPMSSASAAQNAYQLPSTPTHVVSQYVRRQCPEWAWNRVGNS